MDANAMAQYIHEGFPGLHSAEAFGDVFFSYDPHGELDEARRPLVATITTGDTHDSVSDLGDPNAYRLNVGLTKDTYTSRFGQVPKERDEDGVLRSGYDYSARDQVMPHPHYASHHWVCVVTPSERTLADVRNLLDEAHRFGERKYGNQLRRQVASRGE